MKTIIEELKDFKEQCTIEKLFLSEIINDKKSCKIITFTAVTIILLALLLILSIWFFNNWFFLILIPILMVFCIFSQIDTKRKRNYLKEHKNPIPKEFYLWKSKDLESLRIKKVYDFYENIDPNIISKRIEIVQYELDQEDSKFLDTFEKVASHFGSMYLTFVIGIFVGIFNKSAFSNSNLNIIMKFIPYILCVAIIIIISYHLFKKIILESNQNKKEQFKDYIFVMQNILLMKESKK